MHENNIDQNLDPKFSEILYAEFFNVVRRSVQKLREFVQTCAGLLHRFEHDSSAYLLFDRDGTVKKCSDSAKKLLFFRRKILGQDFLSFLSNADKTRFLHFLQNLEMGVLQTLDIQMESLRPLAVRIEGKVLRTSGSVYCHCSVYPSPNKNLRFKSIQKYVPSSDFRKLFIKNPIPMAIVSLSGKYLLINTTYARLFEVSAFVLLDHFHGEHILDPTVAAKYSEIITGVAKSANGQNDFESVIRRPNGTNFVMKWTLSPIFSNSGATDRLLITAKDVTSDRVTQTQLLDEKQKAEALSLSKSRFLANMSHEIRTPLCSIIGFSELMCTPGTSLEDCRIYSSTVFRNSNYLLKLVNDILDLTKVEEDLIQVEELAVDMRAELQTIATLFKKTVDEKGLIFTFKLSDNFPKYIYTDPTRLKQILINIISNSLKFTKSGSVKVSCYYSRKSSPSAGNVQFFISDTGCGIPYDKQQEIFEPFVQAELSTTREFGGTGLGLPIARKLARLLHGDLQLKKSTLGVGSVFNVSLFCKVVQEPTSDKLVSAAASSENFAGKDSLLLNGFNILVADDGLDNRELIKDMLVNAGAKVDVAKDGFEAMKYGFEQAYDVILMDIKMPRMDGFSATAALRQHNYKNPIVAISAYAMIEEKNECYKAGCDGYLSKPFTSFALINAVKQASHLECGQKEFLN